MKRYILLVMAFMFIAIVSKAQDIITLTNGNTLQAKVLTITPTEVTYKDYNNQDGPTITILKAGVTSIAYANGTKTVFTDGDRPVAGSFSRSSSTGHDDRFGAYKRKAHKTTVKGWYFGVDLGFGIGSITSNDPTYTTSSGSYSNINILATKMFNQHLGIEFGIGGEGFSTGINYNSNSQAPFYNDNFTQSYITIPVRVLYFSNSKSKIGFYAKAGCDFAILDGAGDAEGDDLSSYYRPVMVTGNVSCGVDFRNNSSRGIWMLGPFFSTSITNAYSGNAYEGYNAVMNSGNSGGFTSVGLSISYMAKFGR